MCKTPYRGRRRHSSVLLDCDVLHRHIARGNWTHADLANKAGLATRTIANIMAGRRVQASTATRIAEALGVAVSQLTPAARGEKSADPFGMPIGAEWKCAQVLGPWVTVPNGLQYRVCRMEHRHMEGRFGRGKFYDLRTVPERLRPNMDECLTRHAKVCHAVGPHPNLIDNLSCVPHELGQGWWVIDRWADVTPLGQLLGQDFENGPPATWVLIGILDGLLRLHECGVVFRELTPDRVLLNLTSQAVMLTDFELAKLLKDVPSVSAAWDGRSGNSLSSSRGAQQSMREAG